MSAGSSLCSDLSIPHNPQGTTDATFYDDRNDRQSVLLYVSQKFVDSTIPAGGQVLSDF